MLLCPSHLAHFQTLLGAKCRIIGDVWGQNALGVREALPVIARARTLCQGKCREKSQNIEELHDCAIYC